MFTITPEVASLGLSPPRQSSRVMMMMMMMIMRRLTDVYHHARGRELRSVSTAPEARSMYDVR